MKQIKVCNTCKKHTSTLYANRCEKCYKEYKEVETAIMKRVKAMTIRGVYEHEQKRTKIIKK